MLPHYILFFKYNVFANQFVLITQGGPFEGSKALKNQKIRIVKKEKVKLWRNIPHWTQQPFRQNFAWVRFNFIKDKNLVRT